MTLQLIARIQIAIQKSKDFNELISLLDEAMKELERLRIKTDEQEYLIEELISGQNQMP